MLQKLLTGVITVLPVLVAAIGYQYRGMPASIRTLTQRVTDLEVQNMQLLKQLKWDDGFSRHGSPGTITTER